MSTYRTLKAIAARSRCTIVQDAFGVAALVVMLVASLHLPDLV